MELVSGTVGAEDLPRYAALLGVVLLLVTAGCLGNGGGSVAPGVSNEGITNVNELLGAHQEGLLADGTSITLNASLVSANGTTDQRTTQRLRIGPNASSVSASGTGVGIAGGQEEARVWLNESISIYRLTSNGSTDYRVLEPAQTRRDMIWAGNIRSYIASAPDNFSVTGTQSLNGVDVTVLEGSADLINDSGGSETEMEIMVGADGVIWRASVSQSLPEGQVYEVSYSVTELGVDPVVPEWVDSVPESAYLDVNIDAEILNGSVIRMTNTGSDAVPRNSTIQLATINRTGLTANTSMAIGVNESRYVYVDGAGELVVTDTEPSAGEAESLGTRVAFAVDTMDGVRLTTGELAVSGNRQPTQP